MIQVIVLTVLLFIASDLACAINAPSFDTSMGFDQGAHNMGHKSMARGGDFLKFLMELYERNNPARMRYWEKPIIPKIIHQIWLGPATPPQAFPLWQKTIRDLHPDWEYKLWTDKDIAELKLYNEHLYNKSKNYGERSDIARYEILYKFGGLYLDVDFEALKPFDELHHMYDFYTGIVPHNCTSFLANGIIGCTKGHPIMRGCITFLSKHWKSNSILKRAGPQHFEKVFWEVARWYRPSKIIALPASYFFPIKNTVTKESWTPDHIKSLIKPETFAIHHWTGTWILPSAKVKK